MRCGKDRGRAGRRISTDWDPDERKWLDDFLAAIRNGHAGGVKDIVIYGSKARGDWHKDSDIDVLLILSDEAGEQKKPLENMAYDLSVTADALPYITTKTEGEWRRRPGAWR